MAQAGRFRHRITIQEKTHTQNELGEPMVTWHHVVTVWAERKTLRGREFMSSATETAAYINVYVIRYRPGIHEQMRLIDGEQILDIRQVLDPDGRRRLLEVRATRVVR